MSEKRSPVHDIGSFFTPSPVITAEDVEKLLEGAMGIVERLAWLKTYRQAAVAMVKQRATVAEGYQFEEIVARSREIADGCLPKEPKEQPKDTGTITLTTLEQYNFLIGLLLNAKIQGSPLDILDELLKIVCDEAQVPVRWR